MNWPPDVQGFPQEYFSILSWEMQLVRTWHRLDFMLYYRYKKRETADGRSRLNQLRNNRLPFATGAVISFYKKMIVNIITVKAVRNIPICIRSLSVMYTASPPFKALAHFREMNWPPDVQGFPQRNYIIYCFGMSINKLNRSFELYQVIIGGKTVAKHSIQHIHLYTTPYAYYPKFS